MHEQVTPYVAELGLTEFVHLNTGFAVFPVDVELIIPPFWRRQEVDIDCRRSSKFRRKPKPEVVKGGIVGVFDSGIQAANRWSIRRMDDDTVTCSLMRVTSRSDHGCRSSFRSYLVRECDYRSQSFPPTVLLEPHLLLCLGDARRH